MREEMTMKTDSYIRVPITIEQLIQLNQELLDSHALYVENNVEEFDENTIVFLDKSVKFNENTDEEIYPEYAASLNLQWYFSGQVIWDIIENTKLQLKNPTIADYIINFNYYNMHDCFYNFIRK
jgi:hypothetical protein